MKNRNLFSLGLLALFLLDVTVKAQTSDYNSINEKMKYENITSNTELFKIPSSYPIEKPVFGKIDEKMYLESGDCSPIETFNFDFEETASHELFNNYCWNGNYKNYPTVFVTVEPGQAEYPKPNYVLQVYKTYENDIIFVFPKVSTTQGTHLLSFDIKLALSASPSSITGNEKIQIGTMSNKSNFSSFTPYGEDFPVNNTGTFMTTPITFPEGHQYVAMKIDLGHEPHKAILLDNIKWVSQSSLSTDEVTINKNSIYPNPASTELYINSISDVEKVEIYDQAGRLVKTSVEKKIPVYDFMNGIYLMKIIFKNGTTETHKFIKE